MPRQPFLPTYKHAKYTLEQDSLSKRPEIATLIARCIGLWTHVEIQMAMLLSAIMKSDTASAIALFLSLRASRSQTDALTGAVVWAVCQGINLNSQHEVISGLYQPDRSQRHCDQVCCDHA
jgi:hypothetical protein